MLWQDGNPRLRDVKRRDWARAKPQGAQGKAKDKFDPSHAAHQAAVRKLIKERQELGLKEGDAPYAEHLRKEAKGGGFPHASEYQKLVLDIVYERARRSGIDIKNLILDLSRNVKDRPWRDDGLMEVSGNGRPLTGQEELLCNGLPIWQLSFRGLSDADL